MLQTKFHAVQLCLQVVAKALAQQDTAWKPLLLACRCEHLRRQMHFLQKEQTTRWYVKAQHAVCRLSWLADSGCLHLHQWHTAAYLMRSPCRRANSPWHPCVGNISICCCPLTSKQRGCAAAPVPSACNYPDGPAEDNLVGPSPGGLQQHCCYCHTMRCQTWRIFN